MLQYKSAFTFNSDLLQVTKHWQYNATNHSNSLSKLDRQTDRSTSQ